MLNVAFRRHLLTAKRRRKPLLEEEVAGYQLVGEVMAHQGYDGYRV
jgi:hypothetical protein